MSSNQDDAIKKLEAVSGRKSFKLPKGYRIDFAMCDGEEITSWVEVECRKNPFNQYPTLAIIITKLMAGLAFENKTGLPFFLVVHWPDFLGYIRIKSLSEFKILKGGKTDRNDNADVEPMVHIPIQMFKKLEQREE
jgi:hypothetical protein